jgi:hypothetical protein
VIEVQSTAIHTTLINTAVAMLLAMESLHDKQAGFVNLTNNEDLIPCSCTIQAKLAFSKEMKEDAKTLGNVQKWDDLIRSTRKTHKKENVPLHFSKETGKAPSNVPHPVPRELGMVLWNVKKKLHNLIPSLFRDLVLNVKKGHQEQNANAKLEAALKNKKTLDLTKILEEDQAL